MSATDFACRRAAARAGLSALCVLAAAAAFAQKAPSRPEITEADLARVRSQQPVITDADIERARRTNRMPTERELSRVPIPSTPNIDALPKPAINRPIDLEALAKGYEGAVGSALPEVKSQVGPGLLIFVSFAMPEQALSRLVDQATRSGATMVLRGFVNGSLKETIGKVQQLIGGRKVSFQIDPQAFDRFAVAATPTFVLVRDGARPSDCAAGTCFAADAFVSVAGDVSVDYALEYFQRAAPAFNKDAATFLQRLKG